MALFSFTDQELADKALTEAQSAWDAGDRLFAHRVRAGIGKNNDSNRLLNLVMNGGTEIGWELHSLTPFINTIGPNAEIVLVTFRRP